MPPRTSDNLDSFFPREGKQAAAEFMQAMAKLLLTKEAKRLPANQNFRIAGEMLSWWFAGATVLADWIGSNTRYFPYKTPSMNLEEYWECSKNQAAIALTSGVLPASASGSRRAGRFKRIQ